MEKTNIKEIVDNLIEKYNTSDIEISWEGGNDDGSYTLLIGGNEVDYSRLRTDDEYKLVDWIAERMGYYSFAGDYHVNGGVSYRHDENGRYFTGEDTIEQSEEYNPVFDPALEIKIPNYLWFDSVSVEVSGHAESIDVSFRFLVQNGPVCNEHVELEKQYANCIGDYIYNKLKEEEGGYVGEIHSVYKDVLLNRDAMKQDNDGNVIFSISGVTYYQYESKDSSYSISI